MLEKFHPFATKVRRHADQRFPAFLERWEQMTKPQKWAVGIFLVSLAFLTLMFAGNTISHPTPLLYIFLVSLECGFKAYLIARRARTVPLNAILGPFTIAHFLIWVPGVGGFLPYGAIYLLGAGRGSSSVRRGSNLVSAQKLKTYLRQRQSQFFTTHPDVPQHSPQFEIADVPLPSYLENLGFFFVGSPGSGKSQALKKMLHTMKDRPDFRAIILDRNGELLESFYEEGLDLIFNPSDVRSLGWNHRSEQAGSETIAAALVPDDPKDRFFSEAAKSLLSDLYERCDNNAEVWEVISQFSMEELGDFLTGGVSARYFQAENTGASVISTLVNQMRFYRDLPDGNFSFSQWGRADDPRWLFLPIFENESEKFKPLYSMAFDMMLRGLLSEERRELKTAIVIDELGALNQLTSLPRLLSEARKFGGTAMLGTQTTAQIQRVYGPENSRIILQGTATKLILNCRDGKTAEEMAGLIGKQERVDITTSHGSKLFSETRRSEQIRETFTVMPSELQALEPLKGYLSISDGSPPAKVQVSPRSYPRKADRLTLSSPFTPGSGAANPPGKTGGGNGSHHHSVKEFRAAQSKTQGAQPKKSRGVKQGLR